MEFKSSDAKQEFDDWVDAQGDDGYGLRIMSYVDDWAKLMEAQMKSGVGIADCAEQTSREADTDGITGFMYGASVSVLAQCWKYGEELRRWHNLDTQIGNEGEIANREGSTLNPALLNIQG